MKSSKAGLRAYIDMSQQGRFSAWCSVSMARVTAAVNSTSGGRWGLACYYACAAEGAGELPPLGGGCGGEDERVAVCVVGGVGVGRRRSEHLGQQRAALRIVADHGS